MTQYQANAIKFLNLQPETAIRVNKTANRFWLAGVLFSITHGLLKVCMRVYVFFSKLQPNGMETIRPADWLTKPKRCVLPSLGRKRTSANVRMPISSIVKLRRTSFFQSSACYFSSRLTLLDSARHATRYQFIIDVLDVWIPATNIGLVSFNDGVLGLFGLVTSLMALRTQWAAVNGRK